LSNRSVLMERHCRVVPERRKHVKRAIVPYFGTIVPKIGKVDTFLKRRNATSHARKIRSGIFLILNA
jgi:hypothetical protein